jgi:hypothetical protein
MEPGHNICVLCKGTKLLCGLGKCPLLQKIRTQITANEKITESMFGPSPPSLFIGSYNYPDVSWGPSISIDGANDDPSLLYGASYDEIIRARSAFVVGRKKGNVFSKERMLIDAREAVMSIKSVDMEAKFTRKPVYEMRFSPVLQPMGASAPLKNLRIATNPSIPKKVDEVVEEGVRAVDAINELFSCGFDNYYLTRLLSAGVLGSKERKKLVPTRWSITAMDDTLAKEMMKKIRTAPAMEEYRVYSNEYLHNHFEILLMPGKWEYENFEAWAPNTIWSRGAKDYFLTEEHEQFEGRTKYAESQVGGYYAARFSVCEALSKMNKQARAVLFREIGEGYVLPVGVWEIRENVRHAFMNPPKKFSTLREALDDISTRLRLPMKEYMKKSAILPQKRINEF